MRTFLTIPVFALAFAIPTAASAISFNGLTGGQIGINDVVFDGFGSSTLEGLDIGAIDVSVAAASADEVAIQFDFVAPYTLDSTNDVFEALIDFDANVTFGSRNITGIGLTFTDFDSAIAATSFTFLEIGTNTVPGLGLEISDGTTITSASESLAATQSISPVFDLQGEAFDVDFIELSGFQVNFFFDADYVAPPTTVPLPASLGLMAVGIGAIGAARKAKRRG